MDMETTINRNSVKYSVGRAIFCPKCKGILDCKKTIEVTVYVQDKIVMCRVMCANCWDTAGKAAAEALPALLDNDDIKAVDVRIETLDGRQLWKRAPRKRQAKAKG